MSESGKEKRIHVGCQSWQYDDWITPAGGEPIFYPRGTRSPDMLALYSQIFDTIEVDSTAYGTPLESTIENWLAATPRNFRFSLKVPRAITHGFALSTTSYPLFDEFVDASRAFRSKLGVILIQFPAAFEPTKDDAGRLRDFLQRLPNDIRFAVEFRNPGWFVEWTFDELDNAGVALALVAGKWIPGTTMFEAFSKTRTPTAYVRFMGARDLPRFDRIYRDRSEELARWAAKIEELPSDTVFVYVDNHFEGHAPATANKLKTILGVNIENARKLDPQASLF